MDGSSCDHFTDWNQIELLLDSNIWNHLTM